MAINLRLSSSPQGTKNLPPDLVERYTQMQAQIAELEKTLAELPALPAQPAPPGRIGHNNPPEALEPSDIEELKADVRVLKVATASPADKGAAATGAVVRIEAKASKLREWMERRGEEFATEATKAAGKQAGTWLTGAFVVWLVDQLLGLSKLAHAWLEALK